MLLEVNKPKGFFSPFDVKIYTLDGEIFYQKEAGEGGLFFNLPVGDYLTANNLIESFFVNYELPKLPKHEKRNNGVGKFKVNIKNNPNKASIFVATGKIYIDPEIMKQNKYVWVFILLHELGHYFYFTEKYCDLFAAREMLKNGYNPSQVARAIDEGLSDRSDHRKKHLIDKVKQ